MINRLINLRQVHRLLFQQLHRLSGLNSRQLGPPRSELKGYEDVEHYLKEKAVTNNAAKAWNLMYGEFDIPGPVCTIGEAESAAAVSGGKRIAMEWLYAVPNLRFYVRPYAFVTEEDALLSPVSHFHSVFPKTNPAFKAWKLPKPQKLTGLSMVIKVTVWYHTLIEGLPCLLMLKQAGIDLNSIDHFLVREEGIDFTRQLLAAFDISLEKIKPIAKGESYIAETMLVPSYQNRAGNWYASWVSKKLLEHQPAARKEWPSKLYISRNRSKSRRLHNESELLPVLEKFGYSLLYNEDLTPAEQVYAFRNATHIISVHGSNLANIIFCKPGTAVAEMRTAWHANGHKQTYADLAAYHGLRYHLLYTSIGYTPKKGRTPEQDPDAALWVSPAELEKLLGIMNKS